MRGGGGGGSQKIAAGIAQPMAIWPDARKSDTAGRPSRAVSPALDSQGPWAQKVSRPNQFLQNIAHQGKMCFLQVRE